MTQIVKQHKVTGEIVKVDATRFAGICGVISDVNFDKIKDATEKATDYCVIGQETDYVDYVMTAKDKELDAYCKDHDAITKAMAF